MRNNRPFSAGFAGFAGFMPAGEEHFKNILPDVLTHAQNLAYRSGVAPHRATGFSSLNDKAGSRSVSVKRFFCARYSTLSRIMAGRGGEALRPAGSFIASLLTPLRLATTFSSVMASLPESDKGGR